MFCNVVDFFTGRALKGELGTQKAFQGSFKVIPREPEHLGTRMALGNLGTQDTRERLPPQSFHTYNDRIKT